MLDIVASYHCMQFRGKPILQTQENGEKPYFVSNLGPLGPNLDCYFYSKIWFHQPIDIMVSYHHVQYQKRLMIQSSENLVTDGQTDRWMDR